MDPKDSVKMRLTCNPLAAASVNQEPSEQELEDLWDEVSSELSAIFQGRSEIPTDVTPFDAASEVDVDEQRYCKIVKINKSQCQLLFSWA